MRLTANRLWCFAAVALGFGLAFATAYDALRFMVERWFVFDETYSHGLLVFGAVLFLLYRELRGASLVVRPSASGVILAGLTACGIALADVINIRVLQQLGAVFLCWAVVVGLVGWRTGWHFAVPIGFLVYATPIWDQLTTPLVELAVAVNHLLLEIRDIHFRVDGVFIHLLDVGTFEVAGGCSGLRYVIVSLTLASLFSALNFSRLRSWLVLHATAVVLSLIVNWIRIFVIILVGYETEMQSALIKNHEFFGWVLFAAALVPFFYLGNRLMRKDTEAGDATATESGYTVEREPDVPLARLGVAVVATILLASMPAAYSGNAASAFKAPQIEAPAALGEWQLDGAAGDWHAVLNQPDQVVRARYVRHDAANEGVDLGIWYYRVQEQGRELVQYPTRVAGPERWQRVATRPGPIPDWQRMIVEDRRTGSYRAVAFSYYVAGHWTDDRLMVKALMLPSALRGRRDGALVALDTGCRTRTCEAAFKRLEAVVTEDTRSMLSQRLAPR